MVQRRLGSSRAAVEWGDVLELQGLTRRYGDLVALDNLSFTVAEDQMFGFVGPNGAGKTTAMRIILGVLAPDAGEVRWRGQPMNDEMRKHIGYLPEDHGQTFLQRCAIAQERWLPGAQEVLNKGSHHSYQLPNRCSEMRSHLRRRPM
jgi:ABC-type branched-subunit amino acid transport system ATPase component